MKTKMKLIFAAVCVIALVCVFTSKKEVAVADSLQLMNIEALASGEGGSKCVGTGSVDCAAYNVKVYVIY